MPDHEMMIDRFAIGGNRRQPNLTSDKPAAIGGGQFTPAGVPGVEVGQLDAQDSRLEFVCRRLLIPFRSLTRSAPQPYWRSR